MDITQLKETLSDINRWQYKKMPIYAEDDTVITWFHPSERSIHPSSYQIIKFMKALARLRDEAVYILG